MEDRERFLRRLFAIYTLAVHRLEWLLWQKKVHLRPDFEPWIAVDMLSKEERELVFKKAGSRQLPLVFLDGKFIGSWPEIEVHNQYPNLKKQMRAVSLMVQTIELTRAEFCFAPFVLSALSGSQ